MQVIYAAPFMLLSLLAFVFSLAIPRIRPYAFRALIAPVAFGFCSILAFVLILATSHELGLRFVNQPLVGVRGVLLGIAMYFIPGLIGAWVAVEVVRRIEVRVLRTPRARDLAIRIITSAIIFGPTFIVCTAVQFKYFARAEEMWPLCLAISFVAGASAAILSYLFLRTLQGRLSEGPDGNSS